MRIRSVIRLFTVVLLGTVLAIPAAGLAGQATPEAAAANPFGDLDLPQLDITITDTAFEGVPADLDAGRYVIALTAATSDEFSEGGAFMEMPDELTTAEFMDLVAPPQATPAGEPVASPAASPVAEEGLDLPPPWYYETTISGGPYTLPGETRYAVVELTAGEWVFWAEYPGAPQAPVPITITGDLPGDLPTPEADLTIELSEFAFSYSEPLSSGPQIVEITNVGDVPHYYSLGAFPQGTTVADLRAFVEADFAEFSGMAATPVTTGPLADVSFEDIVEVFGTADQSAGVTAWYAIDLEPGTYGAACFIVDPETELPHVLLGQVDVSVVE